MNCAQRLVSIFGSQAEVARRLRLDRAVVNNWVKSGYVPARWAMEIEHATEGKVAAVETAVRPATSAEDMLAKLDELKVMKKS